MGRRLAPYLQDLLRKLSGIRDPPFDYSALDAGRHCTYWQLNPALREEAARVYPDDEFAWAAPRLAAFGELVGHMIADNADVIDDHGRDGIVCDGDPGRQWLRQ